MVSFRCHDNSDVIATLITTNFYLYLIQLWWQFFQMFVYGDVVFLLKLRSYWPRKTVSYHFICQDDLCCCIVWPSFLFDFFVFGQMVYPPPPPCKKLRVRLSSHEKPIRKWKPREALSHLVSLQGRVPGSSRKVEHSQFYAMRVVLISRRVLSKTGFLSK